MNQNEITTGQDSFLDIVANLIGIMIILIVVVGAQAKTAWHGPSPQTENQSAKVDELTEAIRVSKSEADSLQADHQRLERQLHMETQAYESAARQRHEHLVQLEVVRRDIQRQESKLDADRQARLRRLAELDELRAELQRTKSEIAAVSFHQPIRNEIIEHYPTPIAKTVFSDEVHFRLADGRLSLVPMDALVDQMKSEWKVTAEKLGNLKSTVATVGPIDGYRLQYRLAAETIRQPSQYGMLNQDVIQFQGFVIIPTKFVMGEKIDQALQADSEFSGVLNSFTPGSTTVSVWVYPDGYADYNRLNRWLHKRGFQTASWPLSDNALISGGPNGFRSSAQ